MKSFDVPPMYRSPLITAVKKKRKEADKLKKDFSPAALDFGPLVVYLPRHFGFCYGVENAIEIAFRTVEQNPGKRIFLLSEMIHNPQVNEDLQRLGIRFLQDTRGRQLIPFEELDKEDIVMIPAFGTTLEIEARLKERGLVTEPYDTTCPFVEKVWNRSEAIARQDYTIIIHGKPGHEETRATFSHAAARGPALVIRDMAEAVLLAPFLRGEEPASRFFELFTGRCSAGFDPGRDLKRIGVVNQTTMLASDTQAIADFLKGVVETAASPLPVQDRFADTRDTLCYATLDNQTAVKGLLQTPADLAMVVGGYNSSNTSHLVELCEEQLPTYFIDHEDRILSGSRIDHHLFREHEDRITEGWLPSHRPVKILLTSGASCPDARVEAALRKLVSLFPGSREVEAIIREWES